MRFCLVLCLVAGCGGSAKHASDPHDAERAAAAERAKQIEAMKPSSPYVARDRKIFRPTERCGQGPYRFELDSLRASYGEQLVIFACGKHAVSGNYRLTTTRKRQPPYRRESAFGSFRDNDACKARELAGPSGDTRGTGAGGGGPSGSSTAHGGATATAPTTLQPVALESATRVPEDCVRTGVIDQTWSVADEVPALDAHIVLDLWSDEPNDFNGLVFVVERRAVGPEMTLERWRAYLAARDAWFEAYRANLDVEVRAGRTRLIDDTVKTPPPPPPRAERQPPRPSRNARWIPGYWLYADARFHWIAGLWDVPEEDLQQQLTVQAPTPPPSAPARDEPTEPAPTRTAVWTPGSWQWDGRAYIWVAGAWRIPPDADHSWQRATWTIRAGKATFVPGGWRVRLRLGR